LFIPSFSGRSHNIIDGVWVITSVLLVALIGAISEFRNKKQSLQYYKDIDNAEHSTVIRGSNVTGQKVNFRNIVVGDIIKLYAGEEVPADCVLI